MLCWLLCSLELQQREYNLIGFCRNIANSNSVDA